MREFVKISKYAGMREDLVQAGGGNSSCKFACDKMAIKASGFQLADITEEYGYAFVNPQVIRNAFMTADLKTFDESVAKEILNQAFISGKKPSIEIFLHAVSGKYTLHTHPIVVNVLTCRKNGDEILRRLFPDALIVPYATPGVDLARAYFKAYKENANREGKLFDIIFLMNHGLVVSGNSADIVINRTETVLHKIETYLDADFSSYHELTKIWNFFGDKIVWKVTDTNIISTYKKMGSMWQHTFCPDCVVFLGKKLLALPIDYDAAFIENFRRNYGDPVMLSYGDNLFIVANSVKKAFETQSVMSFSAQVMMLNNNKRCVLLSDKEQNFLLNWDAETYRKLIK